MTGDLEDDEVRDTVVRLLRRRRRSFTWCRVCGRMIAPDARFTRDLCCGCASDQLGVVH